MKRVCNDKNQNNNKHYQINHNRKVLPEKLVSCTESTKINGDGVKNM
jgi:hypothetical protein